MQDTEVKKAINVCRTEKLHPNLYKLTSKHDPDAVSFQLNLDELLVEVRANLEHRTTMAIEALTGQVVTSMTDLEMHRILKIESQRIICETDCIQQQNNQLEETANKILKVTILNNDCNSFLIVASCPCVTPQLAVPRVHSANEALLRRVQTRIQIIIRRSSHQQAVRPDTGLCIEEQVQSPRDVSDYGRNSIT